MYPNYFSTNKLKNGEVKLDSRIFPHRTTVSRALDGRLEKFERSVLNVALETMRKNGARLTADFSQCSIDYFVLTAQFVDDLWFAYLKIFLFLKIF